MYKFFKSLTVLAFVIGLFLFFSGNETYYNKSGGTGLVILAVGTPLFAILANIFRNVGSPKAALMPDRRPNRQFRSGLIMLIVGFLIYLSAFVGDQGFGGIGVAALGALVGLAGLVTLFISVLKD